MNCAHEIEVFFDGDCPLCRREVNLIRRMDRKRRIQLTDIASPQFDAAAYGKSMDELMSEMHARLPDGGWITGVEVFRQVYAAVGLRWLVWATRLSLVSHLLDVSYRVFARNRLKWTGRCGTGHGSCRLTTDTGESVP